METEVIIHCPSCKSVATKIASRSVEGVKYDEFRCTAPDGFSEPSRLLGHSLRCSFRAFAVLDGHTVSPAWTVYASAVAPGAEKASDVLRAHVRERVLRQKEAAEKESVAYFCRTPGCRHQGKTTRSQYCGFCNLETVSVKYRGQKLPPCPVEASPAAAPTEGGAR